MKALPLSNKFTLLKPDRLVYLSSPDGVLQAHTIRKIKTFSKYAVISFHDVTEIETAVLYKGFTLYAEADEVLLKEGEFFYDQIIGLAVVTTNGVAIGRVEDILETGSNDVYVVKQGEREYLVPAIADVIKKIDLQERKIVIEVMEGLLE